MPGGDERGGELSDRKPRLPIAPDRLFRPGVEAGRGGGRGKVLQEGAHRRIARDLLGERIPLRAAPGLRIG